MQYALGLLAANQPENQQEVVRAGGLAPLQKLAREGNAEQSKAAVLALAQLAPHDADESSGLNEWARVPDLELVDLPAVLYR